jgi:hypothetical protein
MTADEAAAEALDLMAPVLGDGRAQGTHCGGVCARFVRTSVRLASAVAGVIERRRSRIADTQSHKWMTAR